MILSGNGPQLLSKDFRDLLLKSEKHIHIALYRLCTNGSAEIFMQTMKQAFTDEDEGNV